MFRTYSGFIIIGISFRMGLFKLGTKCSQNEAMQPNPGTHGKETTQDTDRRTDYKPQPTWKHWVAKSFASSRTAVRINNNKRRKRWTLRAAIHRTFFTPLPPFGFRSPNRTHNARRLLISVKFSAVKGTWAKANETKTNLEMQDTNVPQNTNLRLGTVLWCWRAIEAQRSTCANFNCNVERNFLPSIFGGVDKPCLYGNCFTNGLFKRGLADATNYASNTSNSKREDATKNKHCTKIKIEHLVCRIHS